VEEVRDGSRGGNIPKSWLDLGGWEQPYAKDPPDELWRTLVADRGRDNRNPPYYYARACKESVHKSGITSGRVNTTALINNERNSIVAEFCRRVHAVIWNRRLFKTKSGKLELASKVQIGDKVCILYGCTVPVILSCHEKKSKDLEEEIFEDQIEALKSCIKKTVERRERKARARETMRQYSVGNKTRMRAAKGMANYRLETERAMQVAAEEAAATEEVRREAEEARRKAEEARRKAEEARRKAEEARRKAEEARRKAEEARRKAEEARRKAEEARRKAEEARKKAEKKVGGQVGEGARSKEEEEAREKAEEIAGG
jgi:DNA repair exonuclease SbcCD ATPase subunit